MDVPRLEVDSELQLQAYTTATEQDPGCICDLRLGYTACSNARPLTH